MEKFVEPYRIDWLVKRAWPDNEFTKFCRIKAVRFLTPGLGLVDAKNLIESLFQDHGHGPLNKEAWE